MTFRPTTRFAYWIGIRRSPRSTKTIKAITLTIRVSMSNRTGRFQTRVTKNLAVEVRNRGGQADDDPCKDQKRHPVFRCPGR